MITTPNLPVPMLLHIEQANDVRTRILGIKEFLEFLPIPEISKDSISNTIVYRKRVTMQKISQIPSSQKSAITKRASRSNPGSPTLTHLHKILLSAITVIMMVMRMIVTITHITTRGYRNHRSGYNEC